MKVPVRTAILNAIASVKSSKLTVTLVPVQVAGQGEGSLVKTPCYNEFMDKQLVRLSLKRWNAISAVEKKELKQTSIDLRWKQLNSIYSLARELGLKPVVDHDAERVRERWRKIKTLS